MYQHGTEMVIQIISNTLGKQWGSGRQFWVGESTLSGLGGNVMWCWVPFN